MHPLDNPVWAALSTAQSPISSGNDLARRYATDVSPFAGLADPRSPSCWSALAEQIDPEEVVAIFAIPPDAPIAQWEEQTRFPLIQMHCSRLSYTGDAKGDMHRFEQAGHLTIRPLTEADGMAMVTLAELTQPGPMKPRTVTLGHYLGVFDPQNRQLVAMAGERMRHGERVEVSGVCTHPDYRGRSLARLLVAQITEGILANGQDAFLHVKGGNDGAVRVYEKLGYTIRKTFENVTLKKLQ